MNKNTKKVITDQKKNELTQKLINKTFYFYKMFINKPTARTLNDFVDAANNYKEAFIEDVENFKNTNINDLIYSDEFKEIISSMNDLDKTGFFSDVGHTVLSGEFFSEYHKFTARITRESEERTKKGLRSGFNDIQILNRAIQYFTKQIGKPYQNLKSKRAEKKLNENPSLISVFQSDDIFGNTSGPLKLFTRKTDVPKEALKEFNITTQDNLNFTEFHILKYKYFIHESKDNIKTYSRSMPRRTYFEADRGASKRYCWFEARKEFQYLLRYFFDNYHNNNSLLDPRINLNQSTASSEDLNSDEFNMYLSEFSVDDDEFEYFKNNGYKFLFFKSEYKRSSRQMLHASANRGGVCNWIDVCLFNEEKITIRSFTNDLDFVPKVQEYDRMWTGDILVMSNELPKLSHQALSFFALNLEKDYRQNRYIDSSIINLMNEDNLLNIKDISVMLGLDEKYILSILQDGLQYLGPEETNDRSDQIIRDLIARHEDKKIK